MGNIIKLYRYRSLNQFTIESIQESTIWFASPLKFNDPFDCQLFVEYFRLENENKIDTGKFDILQSYYDNYYKEVIYKSFTNVGVACFSATKDEILMWSHYADFHQGICLEFEIVDDAENFFSLCKPVNYCKDYPLLDFSEFLKPGLDNTADFISRMVLTKSKSWEYEKEWRIVLPGYENKKIDFLPSILSAVYLGCNISKLNENRIIRLLKEREIVPDIFRCKKSMNSFSLEYSLIV